MKNSAKTIRELDIEIGMKILHLRLSLGITRQDLAEKIGITHQQLQKYEKGINRITASRLVDIAHQLKVPVDYFFDTANSGPSKDAIANQRQCMEVMKDFMSISNENQRQALKALIRSLV